MISDTLTIVIPTRDRPDLLDLCLRSIFERQTQRPRVVVSDNSTKEWPGITQLRQRYDFEYLRQSGDLRVAEHLNRCLRVPRTKWMMVLHDDDELYPDALENLESVLADCHDVAVVVGGLDYIDETGNKVDEWVPGFAETVERDEAVLRIGVDFHVRSPNTVMRAATIMECGGFNPANEAANDYEFFGRLSFRYGVFFLPVRLGRYRLGHEQLTNVSTAERTELHLRHSVGAAASLRDIGCKPETVGRLVDQMAWGLFLSHAARWRDSDPKFVCRLFDICRRLSQWSGPLHSRVQQEYPILFWRPRVLAHLLYAGLEGLGFRLTRADRTHVRHAASIWKDYSTPPPSSRTPT